MHDSGPHLRRFRKDTQISSKYVLVAPDGEANSWNIVAEESKLDDVGFVAKALLDHIATFQNVNPVFTIFGNSNGAVTRTHACMHARTHARTHMHAQALVNRILIESDDTRIATAVTTVSQLNGKQYRDGKFYIGGKDNTYTTVKPTLTNRKLLQITGAHAH